MRTTKASQQTYARKIAAYVKGRMEKTGSNNVHIYLPDLTAHELKLLQGQFLEVKRQPFDYVYFKGAK
jgi:hypothetical protein